MKAIGIVTETHEGLAFVSSERLSACQSCHNCTEQGSCHAQLVFGNQKEQISVVAVNKISAKQGDVVELESSTARTLLLCFIAFIFPLIMSALAYLTLNSVSSCSNVLPLLMIAVFVIFFVISVLVINRFIKNKASALIVRIIEESKEEIEGK